MGVSLESPGTSLTCSLTCKKLNIEKKNKTTHFYDSKIAAATIIEIIIAVIMLTQVGTGHSSEN